MPAGMGSIRSALAQGCRQRSAPVFLLCVSFFAVNRRSVRYSSVRSFRKITRTKVPQHFDKIILYVYPPEKCSHNNGQIITAYGCRRLARIGRSELKTTYSKYYFSKTTIPCPSVSLRFSEFPPLSTYRLKKNIAESRGSPRCL